MVETVTVPSAARMKAVGGSGFQVRPSAAKAGTAVGAGVWKATVTGAPNCVTWVPSG